MCVYLNLVFRFSYFFFTLKTKTQQWLCFSILRFLISNKKKKKKKTTFLNFLYWFKQEIDWDKGSRTASPMHPGSSLFNLCFTIWCATQCLLHWPRAGILQWWSLSCHPTKSWQCSSLGVPGSVCQIARNPCLEVLVHLLHWEHFSTRKVKRNIILSVLCGSCRCM